VLTPVFKDADTGLNSINPVTSINTGRIQDLAKDLDTGKLAVGNRGQTLRDPYKFTLSSTLDGAPHHAEPAPIFPRGNRGQTTFLLF
jgi:hypothetical protein